MGFSADLKNKKLWYEFDGSEWIWRVGLCFSRPFGMRMKSGNVRFLGKCWYWAEVDGCFNEQRLFWFGIIAISFGKTFFSQRAGHG